MKKNILKFALIAALLSVGLTFKTTPALADNQPCDGVGYTFDGCNTIQDAVEKMGCYLDVAVSALVACEATTY